MLVNTCSIFSFSYNVLYPVKEIVISATFILSSAYACSLVRSRFLLFGKGLLYTAHSPLLTTLKKETFENMSKGENAGNQHFLLFPLCLLPFPKQISNFQ